MANQQSGLVNVENIGSIDRVNRGMAGVSLIMVAVLFGALPLAAVVGIVAFGAYLGLTAFIGWDPIYAVTKAFHVQATPQTSATVVSYQRQARQAYGGDYQQAA